eukprot:CAMPEP_0181238316 /NCGR_PEP_ID=MMETSP1096-20121128/39268_1 /TAXON_ID=156174 ORGANISM="Chrysochromulina ericina, Strain CCMP281" /NCGR_SAMPLE_ID=MMETSP1096 /ASSEMBLY_ACC=CAM_ASM_000453 /LENGTH=76 /DNA_ID=CAMNT_0023333803 /DNA_START=267 /DNA_END=493 /DNA_ORIENTATION=+
MAAERAAEATVDHMTRGTQLRSTTQCSTKVITAAGVRQVSKRRTAHHITEPMRSHAGADTDGDCLQETLTVAATPT